VSGYDPQGPSAAEIYVGLYLLHWMVVEVVAVAVVVMVMITITTTTTTTTTHLLST